MLHTNYHGNQPTDSTEEHFENILPYMDVVVILGGLPWSCDPTHLNKLPVPCSYKLPQEVLFQITKYFMTKTNLILKSNSPWDKAKE